MNNRRMDEKAYGDIPDRFDAFLEKTLREETRKPQVVPKGRMVLAISLGILLLAGTALAVAHSLKIIDLFGLGNVNSKDAEEVISTEITQSGGSTDVADFHISEAYYDGSFLRFIVTSNSRESIVLRDADFSMLVESEKTASLPGERYAVRAEMESPLITNMGSISMDYSDGSLFLYANHFLAHDIEQEIIDIDVKIEILDIDDGSKVEDTTLSFSINKTTTPTTRAYDLNHETMFVRLEKLNVATTPLGTIVALDYYPLLRAFGSFTIVPDDGYVVKDGVPYYYGGSGSVSSDTNTESRAVQFFLPVELGQQESLMLWITNTNDAVEINLDTGVVNEFKVEIISEGNNVKILKEGDTIS